MKPVVIGLVAMAGLAVAGCKGSVNAPSASHHGRYVGVGIYAAGTGWSRMVLAAPPADTAAARTTDDDQVIVVVDSDTGEIRQCGDLTGYCVGMNPWTKALTTGQTAPVKLNSHATEAGWPAAAPAPAAESAAPAQ